MSRTYLLLVHSDLPRWEEMDVGQPDDEALEHAALITELRAAGKLVACSPLETPDAGSSVRVDQHGRMVVRPEDISTGAVPAGFYLVRCGSPEEALAIASRIPDARRAAVLVRPLLPLAGIGLPDDVVE